MEKIPGQKPENELTMKALTIFCVVYIVELFIGYGIAMLIFKHGSTAAYQDKIALLARTDLGYVYLSLLLLHVLSEAIGMHAHGWRVKAQISRPTQYVYKIFGAAGDKEPPATDQYVLMVDDGLYGSFNRAMRAVANFEQYLPLQLAAVLATGYVFPFPIFCVTCVIVVGRILYMVGYAKVAVARGPGFGLSVHLSGTILKGLLLFIGLAARA